VTTPPPPDDPLADLTDEEITQALADLDASLLARSPADFAQVLSRGDAEPWLPYAHLKLLNDKLMRLVNGEGTGRLVVTMPPRHGKSLLCSLYFPAWFLNQNPDKRVILCSYGDDFAATWGRKVRDLIQSHESTLNIKVNMQSKAADRWDVDGRKGGMKTAGVGGQITGLGANLLIIDDPVKNAEEADSAVDREKKWDWWRSAAHTRLEPGAIVVVIQTRWHEDDLTGRILKDNPDEWDIINLPALAETDDPLGRTPGAALCPERYDEEALAAIHTAVGQRVFAALYQQRPTPEGGGFFKKDDIRYWRRNQDDEGFTYLLEDPVEGTLLVPQAECWRFITMDLAVTARTTSDYTVAAVWDVAAYLEPSRLILRHIDRIRVEGAEHEQMVRDLWATWKPSFIGIEEAVHGSLVLSQARRDGILVRPLKHKSKDKLFRAKEAALLTENHRVFIPKKATWVADWEHELFIFPSGTHDDQVDTFAYAAHEILRGMNLNPKKPEPWAPPTLEDRIARQIRDRDRGPKYHPMLGRL
jgi:predicted phage terminase large subunit-like protein